MCVLCDRAVTEDQMIAAWRTHDVCVRCGQWMTMIEQAARTMCQSYGLDPMIQFTRMNGRFEAEQVPSWMGFIRDALADIANTPSVV